MGRIGSWLVSIVLRRPGDSIASRLPFLGFRADYKQQSGMLILTDLGSGDEPGNQVALSFTLEKIRSRLKDNQNISFHNTKTVHYAAWMILPGIKSQGTPPGPAKLAFEINYDGSLTAHLKDLVANCRQELDEVYSFFPDYPSPGSAGSSVKDFLCAKFQQTSSVVDASAYYVALQGRSVEDIRNAIAIYEEAKNFVDDASNNGDDPKKVRSALIQHFKEKATQQPQRFEQFAVTQKGLRYLFRWNMSALTILCLTPAICLAIDFYPWYQWFRGLKCLSLIEVSVVTFLCFIPLLYFVRWIVIDVVARFFETKEEWEQRNQELFDPTGHPREYRHLDLGRQNHLCSYTTVKPESFRMYVIKRTLWLGQILSSYFFILGKLDQISTVHFARWTLIGDQLLFCGNYDGSWSSYLNDFSDEAWGVNLVWGNTIGFPATKFIVGGGARDLLGFQAQAAEHYAPAPVFYSAYRNYSLVNLLRYLEFRDELLKEMAAAQSASGFAV